MIVDSKGELPVALPHVSDDEDSGIPFGGSALREQKAISFSINVKTTHTRPQHLKRNYHSNYIFLFHFSNLCYSSFVTTLGLHLHACTMVLSIKIHVIFIFLRCVLKHKSILIRCNCWNAHSYPLFLRTLQFVPLDAVMLALPRNSLCPQDPNIVRRSDMH